MTEQETECKMPYSLHLWEQSFLPLLLTFILAIA